MTSLSAAMLLSGLHIEQFGDDLQDVYHIASNCLESPNSLMESWRSTSSLSSFSADSGYSWSTPEEPITLLNMDLLEQNTLTNIFEALKNYEVWESAHAYLRVIAEIERKYYVSSSISILFK